MSTKGGTKEIVMPKGQDPGLLKSEKIAEGAEKMPVRAMHMSEAEIKATVLLAKRFPRSETVAYERILQACRRPSFAKETFYSFPRGTTNVTGPSVNLARELGRIWGNIRYGIDIIREEEDSRMIEAWAWDIETNTKISHQDEFKKLIFRKSKGWIIPDERDLRELTNRRGAIAIRNCLLQLLPKDVVEDAMKEAKRILKEKIEDPKSEIKKIMDAFRVLGVDVKMLESYLEITLDKITPDQIVELQGVYKSIKDGNSSVKEYFNKDKTKKATAEEGEMSLGDIKAEGEPEKKIQNDFLSGMEGQEKN